MGFGLFFPILALEYYKANGIVCIKQHPTNPAWTIVYSKGTPRFYMDRLDAISHRDNSTDSGQCGTTPCVTRGSEYEDINGPGSYVYSKYFKTHAGKYIFLKCMGFDQ